MARPPRRRVSATETAEAAFKAVTTTRAPAPQAKVIPTGKELVSLRVDRDVLEHFREDGSGWQDRINAALRVSAGLD